MLFREFAQHGHYADNFRRGATLQGIYCATPSGRLLASINSNDPGRMARMLREALAAWEQLSEEERLLPYDPAERSIERLENLYPEDGLILRCTVRDLPRERQAGRDTWWGEAWNQDTLWIRKDEMLAMLPRKLSKGTVQAWPEAVAQRLARFSLVDFVRGQTVAYEPGHIVLAELQSEVTKTRRGKWVEIKISGQIRTSTTGSWPGEGLELSGTPGGRGVGVELVGTARFDVREERFTAFELAAGGVRWGRTEFNFREGDEAPAGIAFAITLTEGEALDRVAPAFLWQYGW